MARFLVVLVTVIAVIALTIWGRPGPALIIGIVVGVVLFLRGIAVGGGLGNVRRYGQSPGDRDSRVGTCLAAMGIAAEAIGYDPPFPLSFRIFYGICQGVAAVAALVLTGRAAFRPGVKKDKNGTS